MEGEYVKVYFLLAWAGNAHHARTEGMAAVPRVGDLIHMPARMEFPLPNVNALIGAVQSVTWVGPDEVEIVVK